MPATQTAWGWAIALYLFLAGAGAGAYLCGAYLRLTAGKDNVVSKMGVYVAAPLVGFGILFLFFDLGQPLRFVNAFLRPHSSMISVGTWVLTVFFIISFVQLLQYFLAYLARRTAAAAAEAEAAATSQTAESPAAPGGPPWVWTLGMIFAVATAVYTGVLLGVVKAIPFWNTPLLPLLFLISALSTGVGTIMVGVLLFARPAGEEAARSVEALHGLARLDLLLVGLELLSLLFYLLVMAQSGVDAAASVQMLIRGSLAWVFWLGVVVAGLVVPFILEWTSLRRRPERLQAMAASGVVAGLCLLVGGLLLRYAVLAAGATRTFLPFLG